MSIFKIDIIFFLKLKEIFIASDYIRIWYSHVNSRFGYITLYNNNNALTNPDNITKTKTNIITHYGIVYKLLDK